MIPTLDASSKCLCEHFLSSHKAGRCSMCDNCPRFRGVVVTEFFPSVAPENKAFLDKVMACADSSITKEVERSALAISPPLPVSPPGIMRAAEFRKEYFESLGYDYDEEMKRIREEIDAQNAARNFPISNAVHGRLCISVELTPGVKLGDKVALRGLSGFVGSTGTVAAIHTEIGAMEVIVESDISEIPERPDEEEKEFKLSPMLQTMRTIYMNHLLRKNAEACFAGGMSGKPDESAFKPVDPRADLVSFHVESSHMPGVVKISIEAIAGSPTLKSLLKLLDAEF